MASMDHNTDSADEDTRKALNMPNFAAQDDVSNQPVQPVSSTPIEMSEMSKDSIGPTSIPAGSDNGTQVVSNEPAQNLQTQPPQTGSQPPPQQLLMSESKPEPLQNTTPPPLTRETTRPAIGPATDKPSPLLPKETEIEGPCLYITLLLTTGARHPFRLDQRYLKKRNVEVDGNNPINMSFYKLKELILRDWREGNALYLITNAIKKERALMDHDLAEWEAKPSSPESIRLISMGKLLTDKSKLSGKAVLFCLGICLV